MNEHVLWQASEHVLRMWQLLNCLLPLIINKSDWSFELVVAEGRDKVGNWTGTFNSRLNGKADAVLRFVIWCGNPDVDGPKLYDVKEQDVCLVPEQFRNHPHLDEYLLGWSLAVTEVLEQTNDDGWTLLPSDFVSSDVLKLKTPKTADEFKAALLVKSRLGKLINN